MSPAKTAPAASGYVMVGAVRLGSIWGAAMPTGSRIAVGLIPARGAWSLAVRFRARRPDRERRGRERPLVPAGPVARGRVAQRVRLSPVDRAAQLGLVHPGHAAVPDDHTAVDHDHVDAPVRVVVDEALDRIAPGRHRHPVCSHQDEVGLRAGAQAPEVGAPERVGSASGGGVERLRGGRRRRVLVESFRHDRGPAHLLQHVMGARVRSQADRDSGPDVAAERLHRDPSPRVGPRTVGHGGPRLPQERELVRALLPAHVAVVAEEDRVGQEEVGAQQADAGQPLDGGDAVAAHHLAHLDLALGAVNRHADTEIARRALRFAQERLAARVDLRGREERLEAAGLAACRPLHQAHRVVEPRAARGLVPAIEHLVAICRVPGGGPEERADVRPEPQVAQDAKVLVVDLRLLVGAQVRRDEIDHGRAAALQELDRREAERGERPGPTSVPAAGRYSYRPLPPSFRFPVSSRKPLASGCDARWEWRLMSPGMTRQPEASSSASSAVAGGGRRAEPTAVTRSSSTSSQPWGMRRCRVPSQAATQSAPRIIVRMRPVSCVLCGARPTGGAAGYPAPGRPSMTGPVWITSARWRSGARGLRAVYARSTTIAQKGAVPRLRISWTITCGAQCAPPAGKRSSRASPLGNRCAAWAAVSGRMSRGAWRASGGPARARGSPRRRRPYRS